MWIKTINGRKLVCGHIYPVTEIKVGEHWAPADGSDRQVTVKAVVDGWVEYLDENSGVSHEKDYFSFQCRYCKVVE